MGGYVVLIKQRGIFKFVLYCGEFVDFLSSFNSRVYFKIKIPKIFIFNTKPKLTWYKKFCEEFYFLHASGVSILDSIRIFKENSENSKDKKMEKFYNTIYEKLLKGNSLYKSLISTNYKFDNIFLSLIKISEETGNLSEILKNLSRYYEEKITINNKIKSSLLYPILLTSVLIVLFNLCILYFIPNYVASFQTQFSNLPNYTLIFIKACLFIKDNYIVFLTTVLLGLFVLFKSLKFKGFLSKIFFKITIFRNVYFKYCQLKFIQALYYMVNSGVDISKFP